MSSKIPNPKNMNPKQTRFSVVYILIALFGVLFFQNAIQQMQDVAQVPYSEFKQLLDQGKVEEIIITEKHIKGTLKEPIQGKKKQFITARVEEPLAKELDAKGIKYGQVVENTMIRDVLSWVLPVILFFAIWLFLMRRMSRGGGMGGGGFMSVGKSKAKVYVETDTKVTFKDVAGVEEAKEEVKELVDFLKNPKDYGRLGARMPKGILLVGPPGTGKTLLAKAIAGEAAVPFFSISGSEFVEMFVGVGAARVRDLFEQARSKAPCIIFIDELDAMGRARSANPMGGGHDEKEQTLNQLLVELDGFDSMIGIVLIGATNRPEILDPALLRAGRFDRQVLVDRPDKSGRLQILLVHVAKIKMGVSVDLEQIAALTPGFTGADLANLANEAALMATRRNATAVELEDFTSAIERIIAGLEKKNRLLNPKEREVVAYHEMGHALIAAYLPGADPVHKISIIPRGIGALGYTIQRPLEDRYLMTRMELENKMAVLLGGRAAEKITFDHLSTGASDDISRATDIARNMVMRYGMDTKLGNVAYDQEQGGFLGPSGTPFGARRYSEETAREIDTTVRELVDRAYGRARDILAEKRDVLQEGAQLLLEKETLAEPELKLLFERMRA